MIENGYKAAEISRVLGRSKSTISQFLKRFWSRGSVENQARSGRPKIISERGQRKLFRIVKLDRRSLLEK